MTIEPEAVSARIAVIGTGPTGLATALAVAACGLDVTLVGPGPPASPQREDKRTAALFTGSIALLDNLGVWSGVKAQSEPLLGIRLIEDRGALLRAPEVLFSASDVGLGLLGWNVPNAALTSALWRIVETLEEPHTGFGAISPYRQTVSRLEPKADRVDITLDDGLQLTARLVIGADGRNSLCRQAAGIAAEAHRYPQFALVTTFRHSRPHSGISTEFHCRSGPCTAVPLPGNASSLVWVETPSRAEHLLGLSDADFIAELEAQLDGLLGELSQLTPRAMFPLSSLKAESFSAHRTALVGESAHVMPPIGAQGLNLSLRDAAVLADHLAEGLASINQDVRAFDPGRPALLSRYDDARRRDASQRLAGVDLLNRSLLSDLLPWHLGRGLLLHSVKQVDALRRTVMREGLQPQSVQPSLMCANGLSRLQSRARGEAHDGANTVSETMAS